MGKNRKAVFHHYRGLTDESLQELVTRISGHLPDGIRDMADEVDPEWGSGCLDCRAEAVNIQNDNQELVAAYLDGNIEFSGAVQTAYLDELNADSPNFALFKNYFFQANSRLAYLLLHCIEDNPTDPALLNDLAILHESLCMLDELTRLYSRACILENDPFAFAGLAEAFFYNTVMDEFDAFHELKRIVADNPEKMAIVEYLITRHLMERHPKERLIQ